MTSMYPMPRRTKDERFDDGLIHEVAVVLELRGFPPLLTGSDKARLRQHLAAFLYDSGSSAYSDPRSPDGIGVPAPTPARSAFVASERGPGTPDDWPDAHPSWMDPNHELTHYDQLGIPEAQLIDMPGVSSGWYSYTALWRTR